MKMIVLLSFVSGSVFFSCTEQIVFKNDCDARTGYNLKGNVKEVREESGDANGNIRESSFLFFNKRGNIINKRDGYGNEICSYDKHGNLIERKVNDEYIRFTYDNQHRVLTSDEKCYDYLYIDVHISRKYSYSSGETMFSEKRVYQSYDEQEYTGKFLYDSVGNKFREIKTYVDTPTSHKIIDYAYDSNNRLIKEEFIYDHKNRYVLDNIRTYKYNELGLKVLSTYCRAYREGSDETYPIVAYRKVNKKLIRERNAYNKVTSNTIWSYTYDNNNNINTEIMTTIDTIFANDLDRYKLEESIKKYRYQYEYDKYNNWVTCLKYENDSLLEIKKRKITYYNNDVTTSNKKLLFKELRAN